METAVNRDVEVGCCQFPHDPAEHHLSCDDEAENPGDRDAWAAHCSCGWASDRCTEAEADQLAYQHRAVGSTARRLPSLAPLPVVEIVDTFHWTSRPLPLPVTCTEGHCCSHRKSDGSLKCCLCEKYIELPGCGIESTLRWPEKEKPATLDLASLADLLADDAE